MKILKIITFIVGPLLILGFFVFLLWGGVINPIPEKSLIKVGPASLGASILKTAGEHVRGLSNLESLDENRGALFVLDKPGIYKFWMKDMNFPIDILWVSDDGIVREWHEYIAPESYPQVFFSNRPVKYVLEVNAGWIDSKNINLGDRVEVKEELFK